MKHTKTPWIFMPQGYLGNGPWIGGGNICRFVCGSDKKGPRAKTDLKHIAKCVNAHGDLVAACEAALADLAWVTKKLSCTPGVTRMSDFRSICKLEAVLAKEEAKT